MIRALILSISSFMKAHDQMLAATITCFFMLSFIPFLISLASLIGFIFAGQEGLQNYFLKRIPEFFPAISAEISGELTELIRHSEVGLFTLLGYLFFSYHLYVSLEFSVNRIFGAPGSRPILNSVANSLLVVTVLMVVIILAFGTTAVISVLLHFGISIGLPRLEALVVIAGMIAPLFLVFLASTALYVLLPIRRVSFVNAAKGAIFTAVFLEAAKYLFTFYVSIKLAQFGPFYGSLTGIVILIMWLLYSFSVFLIGAGVVHHLDRGDP